MTLERFLEIIENKEYERIEYNDNKSMITDPYIKIYTRNGAFIKFYYGSYSKSLFKPLIKYCQVIFFIPEKDKGVASFDIEENDDEFKFYKSLFFKLVEEVKQNQAKKYF